jgi:hypothetical protein
MDMKTYQAQGGKEIDLKVCKQFATSKPYFDKCKTLKADDDLDLENLKLRFPLQPMRHQMQLLFQLALQSAEQPEFSMLQRLYSSLLKCSHSMFLFSFWHV